jgi:hypothetical protein
MKRFLIGVFAVIAFPSVCGAQKLVPIGKVPNVNDNAPAVWAISGMEMIKLTQGDGRRSPVSRTMVWDARTVEILSRAQVPPLRPRDVKRVSKNGRQMVVVRKYYLCEVLPRDARAEGTTKAALADKWTEAIRKTLPQISPTRSRFGI